MKSGRRHRIVQEVADLQTKETISDQSEGSASALCEGLFKGRKSSSHAFGWGHHGLNVSFRVQLDMKRISKLNSAEK